MSFPNAFIGNLGSLSHGFPLKTRGNDSFKKFIDLFYNSLEGRDNLTDIKEKTTLVIQEACPELVEGNLFKEHHLTYTQKKFLLNDIHNISPDFLALILDLTHHKNYS